MIALRSSTFLLSRRVNVELAIAVRVVAGCDRIELGDGCLELELPFQRVWWSQQRAVRARGRVCRPSGRVVTYVEVELAPWSSTVTELFLRPLARHPERWGARRTHRYFALAHRGADQLARACTEYARDLGPSRGSTVDGQPEIAKIGRARRVPWSEPSDGAPPNGYTAPSEPVSQ